MVAAIREQLASDGDLPVIDCNLRVAPREERELVGRLPERFRAKGVSYPDGNWPTPVADVRDGAVPEEGPAGSSPELTREQHLDPLGIDHAVITGGEPNLRAASHPDRRYAAALMGAYNDWLVDEWFGTDDRLHGSISVTPRAPERAAEEIRRLGDHPDVVQVVMGGATQIALGEERYWPIYEAAVEEDLPVAIRAGAEGYGVANPNTGAGYPSTYLEARSVVPANFMGQLLNLVLEGPFVEFPDLEVIVVGGGYSWIPSFLWRINKMWKGLTDDMPWVERPPSEYVREHMYFVTRPIDEANSQANTERMLEMLPAEETLLFGSNYPHWDSYAAGDPLPELSADLGKAIISTTATDLYDL